MDLQKETPFPMHVPCLDGVGSCEYDLCDILAQQPPSICNALPATQPCSCPLLQGEMVLENMEVVVDDMGAVLGAVMEGGYSAEAKFYGKSNPDKILGCVNMTFELKQC